MSEPGLLSEFMEQNHLPHSADEPAVDCDVTERPALKKIQL